MNAWAPTRDAFGDGLNNSAAEDPDGGRYLSSMLSTAKPYGLRIGSGLRCNDCGDSSGTLNCSDCGELLEVEKFCVAEPVAPNSSITVSPTE